MQKLILENQSDATWEQFLEMVKEIIKEGKVSNDEKQFCYVTTFRVVGFNVEKKYCVVSDLNKESDKLTIYNDKHK